MSDSRAVALYAILARDACDFIDMLPEESPETIKTLYLMLSTNQANVPERDHELNALGASLVKKQLEKRGITPPTLEPEPVPWQQQSFKF